MAVKIVVDSKTQKPSVCNALETLLVDEAIASEFLPRVAAALAEKMLSCGAMKPLVLSSTPRSLPRRIGGQSIWIIF